MKAKSLDGRPRLLVVSHVLPFPGNAGQEQRVSYTLRAARDHFHVTFLTYAAKDRIEQVRVGLSELVDCARVLESATRRSVFARLTHKVLGRIYTALTGLKESNYKIGCVEFSQDRLEQAINPQDYDCVLYEYVHAAKSAAFFRQHDVPTVVDTHNVLWRTRERDLGQNPRLPEWLKKRWLRQYRHAEETAWTQFDGVVAINRNEQSYIRGRLAASKQVFYAPMGIDLKRWTCSWQPADPPRVAFYGGLGSRVNQDSAQRCLQRILPVLWERFPKLEFWLVGSNPSAQLRSLAGPRIKVTGFVERPEETLQTMSLVLCPWTATYGFRSRLVEVMALGIPVVASPEAVDGMELEHELGILLGTTDEQLTREALRLLADPDFARFQGQSACHTVERLYSAEHTYDRLMTELRKWLAAREDRGQRLERGQ